jgi:pimeloyl-ACP methyl ester carboxylesterase
MTFIVLVIIFVALVALAYILTPLRETLTPEAYSIDGQFADVDGTQIHFRTYGEKSLAPPVILIHGFAASTFTWRKQIEPFTQSGFYVIAVDLPASGGSARVNQSVYATDWVAKKVIGLMNHLGFESAHFVGHSFGGRVAMQVALLEPTRAKSIVALAPEAFATKRPAIAKWVTYPVIGYPLAFYSTSPLFVRLGLKYTSASQAWLDNAAVKGYQRPLHLRGNVRAQIAQSGSPKDGARPVPNHLAEISAPTLLIWGKEDRVFPYTDGERLLGILTNAQLVTLVHVGHLPHEENSDEVSKTILNWLEDARKV